MKRGCANPCFAPTRPASGQPPVGRGSGGRAGDHPQVVGEQAEADPALHAGIAVVAAAVQLVASFEPADPSFNSSSPVPSGDKLVLTLMGYAFGRLFARFGQDNLRNLALGQVSFIRRRL